jgi:hypothetical protein
VGKAEFLEAVMHRPIACLTAGIVWLSVPLVALADSDCGWSDKFIEGRQGDRPGNQYDFKFDSRVEKYSISADKYIWCIENKHHYFVTDFHWGSAGNDALYFSSLVEPRKSLPTSSTFSLGSDIGMRHLKYKHTNESIWQKIDVETVFPKVLGQNKPYSVDQLSFRGLVQLAQGTPYDSYRYASGQINVEGLSADRQLFRTFIASEPITLRTSTIVTIPTSLNVLYLLEGGKYEKYIPSDFIRMSVSLDNTVQLFSGEVRSDIAISVFPETKTGTDLKRATEALSNVQIYFQMLPVGATSDLFPRDLTKREALSGEPIRVLYSQGVDKLVYTDAVLRFASEKSDFVIAQVPARVLISPR